MTTGGVLALIAALGRERDRLEKLATTATERGDAPPAILSLIRSAHEDIVEAEFSLSRLVEVRA